ncbi:MAG: hypothetical protein ACE5F1_09460, partial [Planctomycetota bacterium]
MSSPAMTTVAAERRREVSINCPDEVCGRWFAFYHDSVLRQAEALDSLRKSMNAPPTPRQPANRLRLFLLLSVSLIVASFVVRLSGSQDVLGGEGILL